MAKLIYVRTDKNGTKIYHDFTCQRCSGLGASEAWKFTGMTCYECGGSGIAPKPREVREYTPEYEAKLAEKRKARREKLEQELRAKAEQQNAEFLAEYFPNGKVYIVANANRMPDKEFEELKQSGAKFSWFFWYFTEPQDRFLTIEFTPEEATYTDKYGHLCFTQYLDDLVYKKVKALEPVSEWVGTVGEKLTVTATFKYTASYDTKFGTTYVHRFVTAKGEILVWKTGTYSFHCEEDEQVEITATVKDHSEYKGKKQTDLIRCKITKLG